jgi:hypothetical protein
MSGYQELSDAELAHRLGAGDEDAFAEAYRRTRDPIYRFALHMSGSVAVVALRGSIPQRETR